MVQNTGWNEDLGKHQRVHLFSNVLNWYRGSYCSFTSFLFYFLFFGDFENEHKKLAQNKYNSLTSNLPNQTKSNVLLVIIDYYIGSFPLIVAQLHEYK